MYELTEWLKGAKAHFVLFTSTASGSKSIQGLDQKLIDYIGLHAFIDNMT